MPAGSEQTEKQADTAAIEHLRAAHYDPLGMLEFFNRLPYREPRVSSPGFSHDLMMLHGYVEESVPPDPKFIVTSTEFESIHKRFLPNPNVIVPADRPTLRRR